MYLQRKEQNLRFRIPGSGNIPVFPRINFNGTCSSFWKFEFPGSGFFLRIQPAGPVSRKSAPLVFKKATKNLKKWELSTGNQALSRYNKCSTRTLLGLYTDSTRTLLRLYSDSTRTLLGPWFLTFLWKFYSDSTRTLPGLYSDSTRTF